MTALRKQVGQLLIVGLGGVELSPIEKSWLTILQPGGVILFRRNIEEARQTYRLLEDASSHSGRPLFRCVDIEGGLVDRLRDLIAPMPSLAAVAASGKRSLYVKHGLLIGREARVLGFNTVFAPVLDLAFPESQSVMRTRTYFTDPEKLTNYADAFLNGLGTAGIIGCGKHFPGLGGGSLDSHHAAVKVDRTWDALWSNDLYPYCKLKSRLPMVMVSHARYPKNGDGKPASISPYWITEVLKKRIGYRGLIVSDDMEMSGVLAASSIENAAVEAVAAGTHLIEICKDPALILRAYEALLSEAEKSASFRAIVANAYRKILQAKRTLGPSVFNKPPSQPQIDRLRREVTAFGTELPEPREVS